MRYKGSGRSGHSVSGLFVFLLIGLYAIFSLLLVLIGAGVYQGIADDAEHNAQLRTSLSYIAGKIRAEDGSGAVTVEQAEGGPVLVLSSAYEGELYSTRIYFMEDPEGEGGALYELFTIEDGESPDLADGERIADVAAFDVREADGSVDLHVTLSDGSDRSMRVRLRSEARRGGE